MDIQGNPKYRALTYLGICSLEIRKPGPFDGGIYTCKAVNPLGEASVDCRVDVMSKGRTHAFGAVISFLHRWKSWGRDTSLDGKGLNLLPHSGPFIKVNIRIYIILQLERVAISILQKRNLMYKEVIDYSRFPMLVNWGVGTMVERAQVSWSSPRSL